MIPFGNETVTLISRVETAGTDGKTSVSYEKHVITGCSWKKSTRWALIDTAKQLMVEIVCRVPAGQAVPAANDYLILGSVKEKISGTADIRAMRKKYKDGMMEIAYVSDNARPGMPMAHYACRGS